MLQVCEYSEKCGLDVLCLCKKGESMCLLTIKKEKVKGYANIQNNPITIRRTSDTTSQGEI